MRSLHFIRTIGGGAFGTVYLAELSSGQGFRRQVAVKVMQRSAPDSEMFVSRIRDEARLLGLLQDDAILKVLDMVQVEGMDAVLMEYVEGVDLESIAEAGLAPTPRALAEIGASVAGALSRAHTARHPTTGEPLGVIHRDVKPANIMVTSSGGVKLLDFGVARAQFDARESYTGQLVLGTLYYMAPEYIVTGEVSTAADVYSLALALWGMAAGEVFGQPKVRQDIHESRLAERLAQISETHADLVPVLERMLAWDPAKRPHAAEIEGQLLEAADALTGTGLRSWAKTVIPQVMKDKELAADSAGVVGRTIEIEMTADGEARVEPEVPEPSPTVLDSQVLFRKRTEPPDLSLQPPPEPEPEPEPLPRVATPSEPSIEIRRPAPRKKRKKKASVLRVILQGLLIGTVLGAVVLLALVLILLTALPGLM